MSNNTQRKVIIMGSVEPAENGGKSLCAQLSCSAPATFVSRTFPTPASSSRPTQSSAVTRACICGSDLWPYKTMEHSETGRRMGHEAIGVVEAVGADVRTIKVGDLVVMPFAYSDGTCVFCHEGLHTSCIHGGFFGTAGGRRSTGRSGARPPGRRNTLRPAGRQR